ncbi:hypothetical protein QBC47DRAFT_373813 [Echria macrotheca]|uniref:Uncharacterized protein n=1 Tax=Echria macrotheca TaxID=438768 RepID=A0AAJ0BLN5_9PEZI|nr:hypothetical protein QBC47DRAFT_373813 [Echria macrotheca]
MVLRSLLNFRVARAILPVLFMLGLSFVGFYAYSLQTNPGSFRLPSIPNLIAPAKPTDHRPPTAHAPPRYKPTPTWTPPPVADPFPLLATSAATATPPPIPAHNVPRPDLHMEYGLAKPPPLFIGFTRQWPMLLQAVVSYITAGWPASGIYVVENTGVHNANRDGKLSLQNPFFLNHTTLRRLGVNVIQTPVLLSFAQLQNYFLHQAYEMGQPYYFYSHQDVVVFSFEDGPDNDHRPGDRPWEFYDKNDELDAMFPAAAGQPGYRTIYENCLRELNTTVEREERWGVRWFQYDHLSLVNRDAYEAIGGYDAMIPYYMSDCDVNGKLGMDGWTMKHRRVGIINDVSSVMSDLGALYRIPGIEARIVDPNPLPPEREEAIVNNKIKAEGERKKKEEEDRKKKEEEEKNSAGGATAKRRRDVPSAEDMEYFRRVNDLGRQMGLHKYRDGDNVRNTWQAAQRGGRGEPFYYDGAGFGRAFDVLTEAGREIYRQKWGHRDCDLAEGTALRLDDQWRVEKDWEKPREEEKKGESKKGF